MSRPDSEEWRQAYDEEFQGFIDRGAFVTVYPRHGEKILGTTTRSEYKSEGGCFTKRKVRYAFEETSRNLTITVIRTGCIPPLKSADVNFLIALAADL